MGMNKACFLVLLSVVQLGKTDPWDPAGHALDRWKAEHVQALKKLGPAGYQVSDVAFDAEDVGFSYDGPPTSAVVTERTTVGDACMVGMRELALSWKKGDAQATVEKERQMGEDCCDLEHCSARTVGGWMTHLLRLCGENEGQEQRLAALIDPKRAIRIEITTSDEGPGHRRNRWKRADADALCNLSITKFTCQDKTPNVDRFTCSTEHPGEDYEFVWRRTHGAVYIEEISGHIEN